MKRRHFLQHTTFFGLLISLPSILSSRVLDAFEFTASQKRKRVDERWMHMDKSFDYFDYDFIDDMGFGLLRVLDDFELHKLSGTPVHGHKSIEILTILLKGSLFHQDSLGNSGLLREEEYQLMSAGSGLKHAETNPSQFEITRGLQIWISSTNKSGRPSYQQKSKDELPLHNQLLLIASSHDTHAMHLAQEGQILRGSFEKEQTLSYELTDPTHCVYCFVIKGEVIIFDKALKAGDGLGISTHKSLQIRTSKESDFLLIQTPKEGVF